MTKRVRQLPARLSRRQERWIYAASALLLVTGLGWLADHYLFAASEDFARGNYEALWLQLHGAAAMLGLVVFGSLFPAHIVRAWRSRTNWSSGLCMLAVVAALVVTGYGLYYVGDEDTRPWISLAHWLTGLTAAVALSLHVYLGKRKVRRARSAEEALSGRREVRTTPRATSYRPHQDGRARCASDLV